MQFLLGTESEWWAIVLAWVVIAIVLGLIGLGLKRRLRGRPNEDHYGVKRMERYDYKNLYSIFSAEKVLRQVEEYERDGWTLYFLQPILFFILATGGTAGMTAVMRRSRVRDTKATKES